MAAESPAPLEPPVANAFLQPFYELARHVYPNMDGFCCNTFLSCLRFCLSREAHDKNYTTTIKTHFWTTKQIVRAWKPDESPLICLLICLWRFHSTGWSSFVIRLSDLSFWCDFLIWLCWFVFLRDLSFLICLLWPHPAGPGPGPAGANLARQCLILNSFVIPAPLCWFGCCGLSFHSSFWDSFVFDLSFDLCVCDLSFWFWGPIRFIFSGVDSSFPSSLWIVFSLWWDSSLTIT